MKSILGIGNALTDILAVLPDDSLLKQWHLPLGSMQHVDMETGDRIWEALKEYGVKYVPGGSAANTITCTAIFGMESAFLGKLQQAFVRALHGLHHRRQCRAYFCRLHGRNPRIVPG